MADYERGLRRARVKKLFIVATLAILMAGLVLLGSQDKGVSVADTEAPDDEVAGALSETSDSSSSASIAITMYAACDE